MDEYEDFCVRNRRRFAALRELEEDKPPPPPRQRSSEGLIYKTYEQPQQQAAPQQEDQWADWNLWADRKIENALYEFAPGINRALDDLTDELVKELDKDAARFKQKLAEQREEFERKLAEQRRQFEDELAALRVADAITRSIIGERNVLPFDRNSGDIIRRIYKSDSDVEREAATVVELKRSDVA
jgi:hypothetical protein